MFEQTALGYRSSLASCLTKVRSSRARCPATSLIYQEYSRYDLGSSYSKNLV